MLHSVLVISADRINLYTDDLPALPMRRRDSEPTSSQGRSEAAAPGLKIVTAPTWHRTLQIRLSECRHAHTSWLEFSICQNSVVESITIYKLDTCMSPRAGR